MTDPKLRRAIAYLRGETVKREKSRYCLDNPVKKGVFDVPLTPADIKPLVSGYFGRRLAP